jgi:stearoyl-CoA desaturase (Delta-9 desaturase)
MPTALTRADDEKINWVTSLPFLLFHVVPFAAIWTGITTRALVMCGVLYAVRMFAITGGYHRYFSHKSYRTSRAMQFVLGLVGTSCLQQGPLWWAAHHRAHHRHSDTEVDIHSPQKGFWWSHVGWFLSDKYNDTDLDAVKDLASFPELLFLDKHKYFAGVGLGIGSFLVGGWSGLVIGFFGSTILLWHGTFTINSLSHTFGTRRFATTDTSRNNPLLAVITFGEGWHNNHHHYQASARQGIYWWELDISWMILRVLSALHLVRDLRTTPADAIASDRLRDGTFDLGMFRAAWRNAGCSLRLPKVSPSQTMSAAGSALAAKQAAAEAAIHAKRVLLEEAFAASMEAAEELTRTTRRSALGLFRSAPQSGPSQS